MQGSIHYNVLSHKRCAGLYSLSNRQLITGATIKQVRNDIAKDDLYNNDNDFTKATQNPLINIMYHFTGFAMNVSCSKLAPAVRVLYIEVRSAYVTVAFIRQPHVSHTRKPNYHLHAIHGKEHTIMGQLFSHYGG